MRNIWKDGVMGVITGDALGCPVQFMSRNEVAAQPVTGMRGYGAFMLPAGSWTDDSSLTLALLDSIRAVGGIDLNSIMGNFVQWLDHGAYTPFGYAYDIGRGTMSAIQTYKKTGDPLTCGSADEWNNGNGSLMRILPACLYCCSRKLSDADAISVIHRVCRLTHAHMRAQIACGLYYFMARAVLDGDGPLQDRLQSGLRRGFAYYAQTADDDDLKNLACYDRLRNLDLFSGTPEQAIRSSGYVVDTLEAAVWSLITTKTMAAALLKAVNLGDDSDTVGAVAGGLAGLFYGCDAIPKDWLDALQRRAWIESLCDAANG